MNFVKDPLCCGRDSSPRLASARMSDIQVELHTGEVDLSDIVFQDLITDNIHLLAEDHVEIAADQRINGAVGEECGTPDKGLTVPRGTIVPESLA